MKQIAIAVGIVILLFVICFSIGYPAYLLGQRTPSPAYQNSGAIECLATTEGGTKIYKVTDKKAIVPFFVIEGKNGHVSIR